jgi:hypothetical protein
MKILSTLCSKNGVTSRPCNFPLHLPSHLLAHLLIYLLTHLLYCLVSYTSNPLPSIKSFISTPDIYISTYRSLCNMKGLSPEE